MPTPIEKLSLTTVTNKKDSAGTEAQIYLVINGGPRMIWVPSERKKHFQKGKTDQIEWDVMRFGIDYDMIAKVEIFNDSTGDGPGWLIDKITLAATLVGGRMVKLAENENFGWLDRSEKTGDRRELALQK